MKRGRTMLFAAAIAAALGMGAARQSSERPIVVKSPDGRVQFETWMDGSHRLFYRVTLNRRPVLEPSSAGIVVDGVDLGQEVERVGVARSSTSREYPTRGVHAIARERSNDARIELRHRPASSFFLDVRAFNDGVAFRFVVPGEGSRTPDESTTFRLPKGAVVWYHDLEGHYEGVHARKDIAAATEGEWAAPPVTFKLPGGGYASISEGALIGYAGMALQADGHGGFAARLGHAHHVSYPYRLRYPAEEVKRLSVAATVTGPISSPWRVILTGTDLNTLVNSDVIRNVSPPPDAALFPQGLATPWIRPGRAVWRYLDGGDNSLDGLKQFNELAAKLGFEYHVVEGIWSRWTPEQLKEFVQHAADRKVGVFLWKHSNTLRDAAARRAFFALCRDAGVVGAKIDFLDHEAKDVIDHYEAILRDAAEFHLMVNFHGANKPTGQERTWPNELTREGVYGLEHRNAATWAGLDTTLPFTRYLAGAGDFTPVVFGDRRKETSWAHQIATAAVFTSPLLVYGAHPQSLLDSPAVDIIKAIPSTWDETVVLPPSEIGEVAVFARRHGADWFLAVLNGPTRRTLHVRPEFLGSGEFESLSARDDPDNAAALRIDRGRITRRSTIDIELRPAGGYIARLAPGAERSR